MPSYLRLSSLDVWNKCRIGIVKDQGCASVWGDAYTPYASGRGICVQKFGNAYQKKRETNGAFQKHLYHHQMIQRNTEMLFANHARFPFTILVCRPWSFASCSLRRFRLNTALQRCTHHFHDFATAGFLCVLYAENCVHATLEWNSWFCRAVKVCEIVFSARGYFSVTSTPWTYRVEDWFRTLRNLTWHNGSKMMSKGKFC